MTADKLREEINKRKLLAHALVGIAHIPLHRLTAEALLEAYIVLSEADPPQIPTRLRAAQESEPTKENK